MQSFYKILFQIKLKYYLMNMVIFPIINNNNLVSIRKYLSKFFIDNNVFYL